MTDVGRPSPEQNLRIYVHVPFCRTRCRYCDFYRVGARDDRLGAFVATLLTEIAGAVGETGGRAVATVFLGGGTPSLLSAGQLGSILDAVADAWHLEAGAEVTLEANPSDLSPARLADYRAAGVNRLSLGVQSFCDRELALLGRRHDGRRAAAVVDWARGAGFENLSLDLMLGIPAQTRGSLRSSVDRVRSLAPEHVSAYLLEVHAGSEIDALRRRRPGLFPGSDGQATSYRRVAEALVDVGYEHYEISNFALPGRRSRHNLRYWRGGDFLGLGPSAHSRVGGRRWAHPRDLAAYLRDPLGRDELRPEGGDEALFLGLRLADGLSLGEAAAALGVPARLVGEAADRLAPYLELTEGRLRLTLDGFLLSTSVVGELLALRDGASLGGTRAEAG